MFQPHRKECDGQENRGPEIRSYGNMPSDKQADILMVVMEPKRAYGAESLFLLTAASHSDAPAELCLGKPP
jgi:hypothetical protein